jgi:hypothetical protein
MSLAVIIRSADDVRLLLTSAEEHNAKERRNEIPVAADAAMARVRI